MIEKLDKYKTIKDKSNEFLELTKPVMKYLAENYNPHAVIIISSTNAELLSGEMSTGEILDFIKD